MFGFGKERNDERSEGGRVEHGGLGLGCKTNTGIYFSSFVPVSSPSTAVNVRRACEQPVIGWFCEHFMAQNFAS